MASKINYGNKAPFQTREDIPDINKVNAENMNEIKEVVNSNADELDTAKEDIESLQNGQGTSNADITSLKNRVTTLEGDNATNKSDINNLKSDNETNKSNIEELQEDNETNKTNISNLETNKVDKVEGKGLSTEDFTTELKTKLEGLENYNDTEIKQDITEVKQDISNIKENQTSQNSDIEALTNALPSETQEGENVNIKGTIPVKFKEFGIGGNSKQESRSGKNLLYVPDQVVELNGFKIIVENGKYTVEDNRETGVFVTLYLNTNFTLKAGTYTISNGINQNYPYVNLRSNGSGIGDSTMSGGDKGVKTITVSEDTLINQILVYAGSKTKITEIAPQLEEGTQATDFEPYGAMPSPEYPSPIQNVGDNVNLFDVQQEPTAISCTKKSDIENGYWYQGNQSDGQIYSSSRGWLILPFDFEANKDYMLSFKVKMITLGNNAYVRVQTYNNFQQLQIIPITTEFQEVEVPINIENADNVLIALNSNEVQIIDIQVEEGTEATAYSPYKCGNVNIKKTNSDGTEKQTVTFPLQEGQKLYLGDYLASDGIHHVRKQIELDGTEDWSFYTTSLLPFTLTIADAKYPNSQSEALKALSNQYKVAPWSEIGQNVSNYLLSTPTTDGTNKVFRIKNIDCADLDSFKTYLAQQKAAGTPVIIEYELADEEIEAYTEEQQEAYNQICNLKAYEEETNIFSEDEISPIFKVTAIKDFNSIITQLNQLILEGGN